MSASNNFEKRPLNKIFTSVPPKYDLVNRLFSLRLDEGWRKMAARECLANNPPEILDLCTGTGDLAVRLSRQVNGSTRITGLDFSHTMLEEAQVKMEKSISDLRKRLKREIIVENFEEAARIRDEIRQLEKNIYE